jgi:hypothetical protein
LYSKVGVSSATCIAPRISCRPNRHITTPELKKAWQEGRKELFYPTKNLRPNPRRAGLDESVVHVVRLPYPATTHAGEHTLPATRVALAIGRSSAKALSPCTVKSVAAPQTVEMF